MNLHGEHAPDGQDGYLPGAWDEVRTAFTDGHISAEAYDLLRGALRNEPRGSDARKWEPWANGNATTARPGRMIVGTFALRADYSDAGWRVVSIDADEEGVFVTATFERKAEYHD